MRDLVADSPVLLLFLVAATGIVLGRVRVAGFSLGSAAVLFAGLAFGAVDDRFALPEVVQVLGLVLFVYTIGVASGPALVRGAAARGGLRANVAVALALAAAAGVTVAIVAATGWTGERGAGLFAGALTNTPALAAVLEHVARRGSGSTEPVVAYSIAYPAGVIGMLVVVQVTLRRRRSGDAGGPTGLVHRTVRVTRTDDRALRDVAAAFGDEVVFTRVKHDGSVAVAMPGAHPVPGDLVTVTGPEASVDRVATWLGQRSDEELPADRTTVDFRRIFVSSRDVAGRSIGELDLARRYGAVATRVRRGDVELLATDDLVLELGDRVRVVAPTARLREVAECFGDSFRALGEIDALTFSVGIAIGMLLGMVPFPFPGGDVRLGFAGGPLVVGLVLGAVGRTGPFVWQLPYNANLTLRQLGTVLFLAGVGTRSGHAFASTIGDGEGVLLVAAGAAVTAAGALVMLAATTRLTRAPAGVVVGMLAGLQTQPAVLASATDAAGEQEPSLGYALVYPFAMVAKILLAQLLVMLL